MKLSKILREIKIIKNRIPVDINHKGYYVMNIENKEYLGIPLEENDIEGNYIMFSSKPGLKDYFEKLNIPIKEEMDLLLIEPQYFQIKSDPWGYEY